MDIHCTTCGEPWDTYHLRHDAIYESAYDGDLLSQFNGDLDKAAPHGVGQKRITFREVFKELKWEFGSSLMVIKHCPSCRAGDLLDKDKLAIKEGISSVIPDDDDAVASEFSDLGL